MARAASTPVAVPEGIGVVPALGYPSPQIAHQVSGPARERNAGQELLGLWGQSKGVSRQEAEAIVSPGGAMEGLPSMEEGGRIKLVADVALFSGDRVLFVKYKDTRKYDHQAGWFLPDDYLQRLEHPEDAAIRILREQLGLEIPRVDLQFIESFEGNEGWHLVFHLAGTVPDKPGPTPGANTAAMEWFNPSSLPARSEVAHAGWALDILAAMRKPREAAAHTRSVVG